MIPIIFIHSSLRQILHLSFNFDIYLIDKLYPICILHCLIKVTPLTVNIVEINLKSINLNLNNFLFEELRFIFVTRKIVGKITINNWFFF